MTVLVSFEENQKIFGNTVFYGMEGNLNIIMR
jgi:hypothetical protein